MKRIIVLLSAVILVCLCLCSCMNGSAGTVKEQATQQPATMARQNATEKSKDNKGLLDDNREATAPTDKVEPTAVEEMMETVWDDMVENGEVEDGDGNVGERENHDGDSNIDPDAVD